MTLPVTSSNPGLEKFSRRKGTGSIVTATALDRPTAAWCRDAGLDLILIGDSLGMVSMGLPDTTEVTLRMMLDATRAAAFALQDSDIPLIADLSFDAFSDPVAAAREFIAAGADGVKVECHENGKGAMKELLAVGIPVMAHVGLMPQEVKITGGYRVRGRSKIEAEEISLSAKEAEEAGAFALVIENVPEPLAERITASAKIPTIGIGAGRKCDGQILVLYDLLGFDPEFKPRFARRYADLGTAAVAALKNYAADVRSGAFPAGDEITK